MLYDFHAMNAQKKEVGRLTIKQRKTKPPLVQLSHSGRIFNLSKQQLSPVTEGEIRQTPSALNGTEAEFEFKDGQPWRVSRSGAKQITTHFDPKSPASQSIAFDERALEVGQIRLSRIDVGFVVADRDGRDDIRFYTDCLINRYWRPEEGAAVTFVRHNSGKGTVARQIAPLSDCQNAAIIESCGGSDLPTRWRPVAQKYLKLLSKEEQLGWIKKREHYLTQGMATDWWRPVHPEVLLLPSILALLPPKFVEATFSSGILRLGSLETKAQSVWLDDRRQFLAALPPAIWTSISADAIWESSCWEIIPQKVKLRVFAEMHSRASIVDLLKKLDDALIGTLGDPLAAAFISRILANSGPTIEALPATWSLFDRYASSLSSQSPALLASSHALTASICIHPSIEGRLPENLEAAGSPIAIVRPYARFASKSHSALSGSTQFSALEPEDLILAASYFSATDGGRQISEDIFKGIRTRDQWKWGNLTRAMQAIGKIDSREWKQFLVCGIQPRVAEIAFGTIHPQLKLGENLIDLNRAAINQLKNWTVQGIQELFLRKHQEVHEDWRDDRRRYDVKCNLFFRSRENQVGLRGLLIDIKAELASIIDTWLPGFVFHASSPDDCAWSFVGILDPKSVPKHLWNGKVAPFFFTMPDTHRIRQEVPVDSVTATTLSVFLCSIFSNYSSGKFAKKSFQQVIPLLGVTETIARGHLSRPQSLLAKSVTKAKAILVTKPPSSTPTERILWEALNHLVFDGRNAGETQETVALALKEADDLVRSPWLPVVPAKIGNTPLLSRWITQVLNPLNDNWDSISCPNCGAAGSQLRIEPLTSSAEMSIWGSLRCTCGFCTDKITLLTHCHECGGFPLVVGRSRICQDCNGLCCHAQSDGVECGKCKKTCVRVNPEPYGSMNNTSENDCPYD
jgi:hypothetical protein